MIYAIKTMAHTPQQCAKARKKLIKLTDKMQDICLKYGLSCVYEQRSEKNGKNL